jgi:RNA polymerase sigma factor (sigma-70 family)
MDEATLVALATAGDQRAWQLIVARYRGRLAAIGRAHRLCGEEIDDTMQDTWLRAFMALPALRDDAKLGGWLATIMRRQCLAALRERRRRPDHLAAEPGLFDRVCDDARVEDGVLAEERTRSVRNAVCRLQERDRELLRQLASPEGISYDGVARQLRMPRGSVGPTRQRVIHRIRKLIGPDLLTA